MAFNVYVNYKNPTLPALQLTALTQMNMIAVSIAKNYLLY